MNIKIGILNVPKHCNKHDLIHFVTKNRGYLYPERQKSCNTFWLIFMFKGL